MFYLRPAGTSHLGSTASIHTVATAPNNVLVCPLLVWPGAQTEQSWQAIYRIAYEQLVMAFAPSPFQRALEPSPN